ncbi:MAG: hypothetical protein HOV80_37045, partial [Polyangiaceae bacterium]|nr:hypothetical protein [Polyangiaceae bacterium]
MDNVENVRASRGSLPTVPESAKARAAVDEERASLPIERPRLTWAVEIEESDVRAMSTFDLWRALSLGEVRGDVRVWRVGRECWTPAIEVPEIACALRVSLHEVPIQAEEDRPRVTVDYVSAPPQFGISEAAECERDSQNAERQQTITPTPPPRLRMSLPEMIFDPLELSQLEAEVRERDREEAVTLHAHESRSSRDIAPYEPVSEPLAVVESPSSELPQAVVLPPRISSIELDAERPTVLPSEKKRKPRINVWNAAAALAVFGVLLTPAIASDTGSKRPAELDNRVSAAANRAASVIAHGPQAQARIDGEATKIVPTP